MFIKRGDDPKSKIVVVDSSTTEELDMGTKKALDKMKKNIVEQDKEQAITKESN